MPVSNNIEANKKLIIDGIRRASDAGSSFLVTPEGSLSGYTSTFDQENVERALKEIVDEAASGKLGLLLGTCYKRKEGDKVFCYNQVRVYSPEGSFLGAYSKILRCSPLDHPGTGEMVEYAEGTLRTFSWKGYNFGILVCNDLWATPGYTTMPNPYLAWKLKQMGAQFIIHCINSGSNQKYRTFHESSAELWALSVHLPVMEVNAAQGNEIINARSGLINEAGERVTIVPDSGLQFFTVTIRPSSIISGQSEPRN